MESTDKVVVLITTSNEEEAAVLAKAIVEERLAACVNIVPTIRSIYQWQGAIQDDSESLMIVKTRQDLFESLRSRIEELNSYDTPEIVSLSIQEGSKKYLQWIDQGLK